MPKLKTASFRASDHFYPWGARPKRSPSPNAQMPLLCRFFRPYVRDSLTPPKPPIHDQLKPPDKSLEALGALGALGAVKGWGSWLIARPERNVTGAFRDRDNPAFRSLIWHRKRRTGIPLCCGMAFA